MSQTRADGPAGDAPGRDPLAVARFVHAHAAAQRSGIVALPDRGETRRIGLRQGLVYGIDAGPRAPVWPDAQLRYLLRLRATPAFQDGVTLSAKYAVEPFHPALSIRQHIDAQDLQPDPLRKRLGLRRIVVPQPPHASALQADEQALVRFLAEPRAVPELLTQGGWSPLRALRLLVVLDALGVLLTEEDAAAQAPGGVLAEAYAILGLSTMATVAEVKQAYRLRARELHPDSRPDATPEERQTLIERFTALHAAYRRLAPR